MATACKYEKLGKRVSHGIRPTRMVAKQRVVH